MIVLDRIRLIGRLRWNIIPSLKLFAARIGSYLKIVKKEIWGISGYD